MQEPESVTVNIFGTEYTLRGTADAEYVQEVAAFVDRRMNEVAKGASVASTARVAILAAVNIADELFREQRKRIEDQATLDLREAVEELTLCDGVLSMRLRIGQGPSAGPREVLGALALGDLELHGVHLQRTAVEIQP